MTGYRIEGRREKRRRNRVSLWHRFVLLVGYGAILYNLIRGVLYLMHLLGGRA